MAGIISKGIKLSYKTTAEGSTYIDLTNLQEIPALGGTSEKIEVTTLADASKKYIKGLKDYGDLTFKFLYDQTQFTTLTGLTGVVYWQVSLPDGTGGAIDTVASFTGEPSVELQGAGTNAALTYNVNIALNSEITFA